jgi:hypothetical protein
MPSKNRFRLDDDECLFSALPGSRQEKPEGSVRFPKSGPPVSSPYNGTLLAEGEVLDASSERCLRAVGIGKIRRRIVGIMAE